jgi:hypothetical protein
MRTTRIQRAGFALILIAVCASIFLQSAHAQASGNGSFTIATTQAPTAGQVIPTLTWSTTPAGATCTASGDPAWTGAKAASGTQALPARVLPTPTYALTCTWPGDTSSLIRWTAPTQNTDGSDLTNLAGFRVIYGASATALTQIIQVTNAAATSQAVTNLTPGTWFFSVKAYTALGAESAQGNVASKVINAGSQWTASVGVKVPNAPTNVLAE